MYLIINNYFNERVTLKQAVNSMTSILFTASAVAFLLDYQIESMIFLTAGISIYQWVSNIRDTSFFEIEPVRFSNEFKQKMNLLIEKLPDTLPEPIFNGITEEIEIEYDNTYDNPYPFESADAVFQSIPDPDIDEIKKAIVGTSFLKAQNILNEIGCDYKLIITNKDYLIDFAKQNPTNTELTVNIISNPELIDFPNVIYVKVHDNAWLGKPTKNTMITDAW